MRIIKELEQSTGKQIHWKAPDLNTLGLNHLSWHRGLQRGGEDVWPHVLAAYIAELKKETEPETDPRLVESLGMIPNYYLGYFSRRYQAGCAGKVAAIGGKSDRDRKEPASMQYADPDLKEPPADLMLRAGPIIPTVATQLLNAHYNDMGETHVVNVRHNGAGAGLAGRLGAGNARPGGSAGHPSAAGRAPCHRSASACWRRQSL